MDLKKKFKSLITRQESGVKSPTNVDEASEDLTNDMIAIDKHKEIADDYKHDPQLDRETIDTIESVYYSDGQFDSGLHELNKLHEDHDLVKILSNRDQLRKQLQAVSKKVYELVLQNQSAYTTELKRVMELKLTLHQASEVCEHGRRHLERSKQVFTTASLGLLSNYRKRQQLHTLLAQLKTIKTLQRSEIRLRELLEEEDFCGAIQLCLECQKVASTYRHYHCISELSSKLQDTLVMIEEQLDVALSKTCAGFEPGHYEKVQRAYQMLGKTQTAMDQLHMHYASFIHNTAFTIILGYVELTASTQSDSSNQKTTAMDQLHMHYASFIHNTAFTIILGYVELTASTQSDSSNQKRQYYDLCKQVTADMFIPCLTDVCKALWEGMRSYSQTIAWHERQATDPSDVEATLNRRYIQHKLEHGLGRVWQDVQAKVKAFVLATDLTEFKFDGFITILDLVNRLIMIGEEFCGSKSEQLQDSLKQQSLSYFRNYHRARLDELRMFLENEGWEMCPVKANFNITQLIEFRFLQQNNDSSTNDGNNSTNKSTDHISHNPPTNTSTDHVSHDASVNGDEGMKLADSTKISDGTKLADTNRSRGYFARFLDSGNPFDICVLSNEREDVLLENGLDGSHRDDSDSDSDVAEELKMDYVDENTGEIPIPKSRSLQRLSSRNKLSLKSVPIVSNTVLNVLRVFGTFFLLYRPLEDSDTENDCSKDSKLKAKCTVCDSVLKYTTTTKPNLITHFKPDYCELSVHNRLRMTLQRIRDTLIAADENTLPNINYEQSERIGAAHMSPAINTSDPSVLFGLSERVVAVESLVFLASQLDMVRPHLEEAMPVSRKVFLQQFYSQTISTAVEVRKPVYGAVSARTIDHTHLLHLMSAVKWDVREIMSQHNQFVDFLLKEYESFSGRLCEVRRHVPIHKHVHDSLWQQTLLVTNRTFVEGYASAKKCSNEGRALMQLDYQQYATKLEKLSGIRPLPRREYVDSYIKAYYLPEQQLEMWVRENKQYHNRLLTSLVNCVDHLNKKTRQRIIAGIDDTDKIRR